MCGIAGIIKTSGSPVLDQTIQSMTSALSHRGPDGFGTKIWGAVGLGHRRLSIIDLELGKQPLSNEDGQIWISYNGEVYNFQELRKQLVAKGHQFRTHSDTEVIVHAYEEWGKHCVEHFRGMFAFAIVDLPRRQIFIARDHLGIKPLYYLESNSCFAFASEIQALRKIPDVTLSLDLQSIDQYLWLQYIPAPRSIFREIRKLRPGHRMIVRFDGATNGPEEYWKPHFSTIEGRCAEDWLEEMEQVIRDSVQAHLVADVPFGAFLSGGVDSSSVVAYMAQVLKQPVRTFSIGFDEEQYSELPYAKAAAERWKTEHHVEIVKPNALEILPQLVKHYGEPFGDSSALPTYYVCQMARRHVPMVLSGDGGDELFAGYSSYCEWLRWLDSKNLPLHKRLAYPFFHAMNSSQYPARKVGLESWLRIINYMPHCLRNPLWKPEYCDVSNLPLDVFEQEYALTQDYPPVQKAQFMDLRTYLPNDILMKVDAASMIHSLEVRTPLVDVRVVEFASTIPHHLNIQEKSPGLWEGKVLLKRLMERYYPQEFIYRKKMGFSIPIDRWFGPNGTSRKYLEERLLGKGSKIGEYFEASMMQKIFRIPRGENLIWVLLFLEEWLAQNEGAQG